MPPWYLPQRPDEPEDPPPMPPRKGVDYVEVAKDGAPPTLYAPGNNPNVPVSGSGT